jgi:HEAT repeat protein
MRGVRETLVRSLAAMGRPVTPLLLAALEEGPPERTPFAISTLIQLGPEAEEAIPMMLVRLTHRDSQCRETAALALGRIARSGEVVVPALRKGLADPVGRVRATCAEALIPFARSRAGVVDDLRTLAREDEFHFVRATAEAALKRIADEDAELDPSAGAASQTNEANR